MNHSAMVHVPLALSVLFPVVYIVTLYGVSRQHMSVQIWRYHAVMQLMLLLSSGVAYWSGLNSKFLSPADQALISNHEQLAAVFVLLVVASNMAMVMHIFRLRSQLALKILTVALLLVQAGLAIWLGHLGGQLRPMP